MASVQHSVIVDDSNNNNEFVAVQIEQQPNDEAFRPAPPEVPVTSGNRATRLLFVLGFLTVLMDLATFLYKPPRGVWFETRKLAYYLTLAGIFAAGLAEIIAAFWMCRPSSQHVGGGWHRTLESVVLLASIIPFVAVIALGGFTVLVKI